MSNESLLINRMIQLITVEVYKCVLQIAQLLFSENA